MRHRVRGWLRDSAGVRTGRRRPSASRELLILGAGSVVLFLLAWGVRVVES